MPYQRSSLLEVRNPVLRLPGVQALMSLPPDSRDALRAILLDISRDAAQRAESSWRKSKAPMAAYWKATSVYAKHIARALRRTQRKATGMTLAKEELLALAADSNLHPEDLDDIVHQLKSCEASTANNNHQDDSQDEDTHELLASEASDINNAGIEAQIEYILESVGRDRAVFLLNSLR